MPLLVLILIAGGVAIAVAFVAWHYPTPMASPTPSLAAAKAVGRQLGHHGRLRRTITSRVNPGVATGLALTVALGVVAVGGFVIGTLAYLVRTNSRIRRTRYQRRSVERRSCGAGVRALAERPHATRLHVARRRSWRSSLPFSVYRRRAQPLDPSLSPDCARGSIVALERPQGFARPRPAHAESDHRDTRAVVPERSLHGSCCVLRRGGAGSRPRRRQAWPRSSSPVQPSVSPSPWRARASCSTCTGSPTSSQGSFSVGHGLQPAASPSGGVACFASVLQRRRPCKQLTPSSAPLTTENVS